ncbi:hypothetical protein [Streptomyces chryseus]|uniref:Uncharacterized protein n=1 Tax=Streptomyces chryseus TaxID=68186 RepID=A0ABQ3DMR5_9ACTN|nr:hypothetical protein [Streptomyces chryseus]GGX25736.1 hypothetical protein GCM10010353_45900 [Streptomyces chryseus]GHB05426.1 hypothetical protein GCM10010346_30560 [Streptomyces chryseus]
MAVTNPVWFYSARLPPYDVEGRALFHTERRPDGSWTSMRPLPGAVLGAASFAGVQSAAAGMADGSVVVLGIAPDNALCRTCPGGTSEAG